MPEPASAHDALPSTTCYVSSVETSPLRSVQRVQSEASLPSAKSGSSLDDSANLVRLMNSRLRVFSRPRTLGLAVLWSVVVWLLYRSLSSTSRGSGGPNPSADFPLPAERAGSDWLDSVDSRYRTLVPLQEPPAPFPQLRPTRFLPPQCLESWFIDGTTSCGKADLGPEDTLDAAWLWVNGSDQRWRDEMEHWKRDEGIYSPEQHFRSVHSVAALCARLTLPGTSMSSSTLCVRFSRHSKDTYEYFIWFSTTSPLTRRKTRPAWLRTWASARTTQCALRKHPPGLISRSAIQVQRLPPPASMAPFQTFATPCTRKSSTCPLSRTMV